MGLGTWYLLIDEQETIFRSQSLMLRTLLHATGEITLLEFACKRIRIAIGTPLASSSCESPHIGFTCGTLIIDVQGLVDLRASSAQVFEGSALAAGRYLVGLPELAPSLRDEGSWSPSEALRNRMEAIVRGVQKPRVLHFGYGTERMR